MDVARPLIRDERPDDVEAIDAITRAAFRDHPHSRQTEHMIVTELRRAGALTVSLVAEVDGAVVGHAAFSPVAIGEAATGWHGLGPLSVAPAWQRRGVGQALVREGLARLRALGSQGCVLVGEAGYYTRFGFAALAGLSVEAIPPEYVLGMAFGGAAPSGAITFHPAFGAH